jgi:NADPH:quinone reductase-like Zn-dependent oxidoreductase
VCARAHILRTVHAGFELAGEVLAIGRDVRTVKVGDRVCALKTEGRGAFAQMCLVDERDAHTIPYNVDYETAAAMPVAYGTALHTLRDVLRVHKWEKVKWVYVWHMCAHVYADRQYSLLHHKAALAWRVSIWHRMSTNAK